MVSFVRERTPARDKPNCIIIVIITITLLMVVDGNV
jgi:hypothetical protein